MNSIQDYLLALMSLIQSTIIPFLFGLALLFFVWNAFRYLILGGAEKDAREKAKNLMLYSVGAFVLMVSIWGIVNLIVRGLGLEGDDAPVPDYIRSQGQSGEDWWDNCLNSPGTTDCD